MSRRRRGWRERGNYVWRTRKPHAPLGLASRWLALAGLVLGVALYIGGGWWWLAPLVLLSSGRHTAYVGQTSSRYHRDRQHRGLDPRHPPSPWSDLDAVPYPLPSLPWWRWSRELSEWFWTIVLLPVYPVPKQAPWNLRRISKVRAQRQRAARDARRAKSPIATLVVDILVTCVRLGLGLALLGGATYYTIKVR